MFESERGGSRGVHINGLLNYGASLAVEGVCARACVLFAHMLLGFMSSSFTPSNFLTLTAAVLSLCQQGSPSAP